MFKAAERIEKLPPYLFVEIDKAKRKARAEGRDIIDLGVGDPDQPTPDYIIRALNEAVKNPATHRYAFDQGMPELRQAIAGWYKSRFGVSLNFENEVLPLIGSKEGLAHIPLAFINPGDYALITDPCYPAYKSAVILAGGNIHLLPLKEEAGFLPDFREVPAEISKKAKLIFINYPNNPTSAVADRPFYEKLVRFALENNIIIISDLAYSEITFDGYKPLSLFEIDGAKEAALEFHSLSKTYNMTGWRIGWASGSAGLISNLAKVKANIDSGIFSAIQLAGVSALKGGEAQIKNMCRLYQERRDTLLEGLSSLGWKLTPPKATFYQWIKIPVKLDSMKFAAELLDKADIIVTPGIGFGKYGEGYIRMALTVSKERIREAVERIKNIKC